MSCRVRQALVAAVCTAAMLVPPATAVVAEPAPQAPAASSGARAVTPVLSARRVPELLRATIADQQVRDALQPLVDDAPENSCIVVSQGGRHIVNDRADHPMSPASTEKLLTGVAALRRLGPDTRLRTVAAADAAPRDGVVDGDLYLVGGGDPILTTEGYRTTFEDPAQAFNDFNQLADRIAASGVKEIRGRIVGDDSRYDTERWVVTWPTRYQRQDQVGPLSALIVNDGSTGLTDDPNVPAKSRKPGDPPALAAATLKTLLVQRGVTVRGDGVAGKSPQRPIEVAVLESLTVRDLVTEMLTESDNTTAELLTKELGHKVAGSGTTQAGTQVIVDTARDMGLPVEGVALRDGSGLDPDNHVTCGLLVDLLDVTDGDDVAALLPIAGQTGTLRKRMRGTPAEGKVHAKTGTLNEVNALAGVATTPGGSVLHFAYLINGPEPRGFAPLDELASALVTVPDGPPVAPLEPKPAATT